MQRHVSILGCGYLGVPTAVKLVSHGWQVRGSTTRAAKLPHLRDAGIDAYHISVPDRVQEWDIFHSDRLLFNIPLGRRRSDVAVRYRAIVECVTALAHAAGVKHVLFVSSTSVYGHQTEDLREEDTGILRPRSASGEVLLWAEQAVRKRFDSTVLRLGGLYGCQRPPGRFTRGRLANPDLPVNMVHRDDAVAAACAVLEKDVWGETFNVCAPEHPTRAEFYGAAARWLGKEPPSGGATDRSLYRCVSSRKLTRHLGFTFKYPDPLVRAP